MTSNLFINSGPASVVIVNQNGLVSRGAVNVVLGVAGCGAVDLILTTDGKTLNTVTIK
jgi:hypothetical protein